MSLEQSMTALAESQNALATAMTRYAAVMEKHLAATNGGAVPAAAAAATNDEPAAAADKPKGKRRTQAEIAADAKAEADALAAKNPADTEVDPFADEGEEETAPALTADDIRKLVLKVKEKNKDHAMGILKKIGVSTLASIEEKDYPEVVRLAGKVGVTL